MDRAVLVLFHFLGAHTHPSDVPEDQKVLAVPLGDEERVVALVSCAKIMSHLPDLLALAQQALKQISLQEQAEVYP